MLSSTVLDAHATMYSGLELSPATPGPGIRKRNDGYVDDVNTWAGCMEIGSEAAETIMYQLQKGSQILTDLNETSGGSTAFHKCTTQLMSWVATPEFLEIDKNIDQYRIVLEDAVGAKSTIAQLMPHEANKGLGYHFAMMGPKT